VLTTDLSGVIIIDKSGLLLVGGMMILEDKLVVFESGVECGVIGSMPSKFI